MFSAAGGIPRLAHFAVNETSSAKFYLDEATRDLISRAFGHAAAQGTANLFYLAKNTRKFDLVLKYQRICQTKT